VHTQNRRHIWTINYEWSKAPALCLWVKTTFSCRMLDFLELSFVGLLTSNDNGRKMGGQGFEQSCEWTRLHRGSQGIRLAVNNFKREENSGLMIDCSIIKRYCSKLRGLQRSMIWEDGNKWWIYKKWTDRNLFGGVIIAFTCYNDAWKVNIGLKMS
jgi:hypothetical protein